MTNSTPYCVVSRPRAESRASGCSSVPCLNGGTCFDHTFAYSCVCAKGYAGYNCEANPNECASSPCMNSGTCTDLVNAYECTCEEGVA